MNSRRRRIVVERKKFRHRLNRSVVLIRQTEELNLKCSINREYLLARLDGIELHTSTAVTDLKHFSNFSEIKLLSDPTFARIMRQNLIKAGLSNL